MSSPSTDISLLLLDSSENLGVRRVALLLVAISVLLSGVIFVGTHRLETGQLVASLAGASLLLILVLAGLYLYAYGVYQDSLYLLLSTAWLALACAVFVDATAVGDGQPSYTIQLPYVFSAIVFYVSGFTSKTRIDFRRLSVGAALWVTLIFATMIVALKLRAFDERGRLVAVILAGSFGTVALLRVGNTIRDRLNEEHHGRWRSLLWLSFYAYGVLQLAQLISLVSIRIVNPFLALFALGLGAKLLNGVSLVLILRRDSVRAMNNSLELIQTRERTVLEDLGTLAAGIEHDLRNPLGVMRADIDYMKARFQAHNDVIEGLSRIEEQMDRIVVTRIIPILRGGPDYFTPGMVKLSLRAVLDRSVRTVKAEGNVAGILFKVSERVAFCKANQMLLEQAIVNVLKNSVEAIREARRERGIIEIEVRRDRASQDYVRVEIKDNGCGILQEHMSKLTTLFTTKSSTKPNSGLGLFMTQRILKLHKGTLEIESISKEGTTVSLLLPKWKPEERSL